ncbi:MAG: hypothetical protein HA496_00605 [Thaumarchaeota archaeon]|jgi:hypothetical protein|nr:hypothetical protein [Nitrososphaerota archaeon]
MSTRKPAELRRVVWGALITGFSLIIISLIQMALLKQAGKMEQLSLGVLTILLVVILEKAKGFLSWLLSIIVFMVHIMLGLIFFIFGFLPPLLSMPQALTVISYILPLVFGSTGLFYFFASESLNEYFGTETIFPVIKKRIIEQPVETLSEMGTGETQKAGGEHVVEELKEAVRWINEGRYDLVVRYSAELLKDKLISKLGLQRSLANEEIIERLQVLVQRVDVEAVEYVFELGEKCAYAGYKPSIEEAEKVLKNTNEVVSKL